MTLFERPLFHHLVNGAVGTEDALEEDYFVHFLVDVGFLLDGLDHFLEILFLTEVFDATEGEMRHEILAVAKISDAVEGCQDCFFELEKFIGSLLHAEPEHSWGVAGAEDAGAVEVHSETLLIFKDFRDGFDDFRLVLRRSFANEF